MNTGSSPNQERVLSVYAEDKLNGTLSASETLSPCARWEFFKKSIFFKGLIFFSRNTFIIRGVESCCVDGTPLRYGQRFRLESVASNRHCLNSGEFKK